MLNEDSSLIYEEAELNEFEIDVTESYIEDDSDGCFMETTAYEKLMVYFQDEMPMGVSQGDTGEPDMWIIDYLATCI
jgi:hypothetical protein